MTPTPHDCLFRAVFSVPTHAAALLQRILPRPLVDAIDWSTLQCEQGVLVDRKLDAHATDLLFRVELRGYPGEYIYILLEHQSCVDWYMPLRFTEYHVYVCKLLRTDCRPRELPTVVPVLVSHAVGGWKHPHSLDDLFTLRPTGLGIADYVPRMTMLHLDLTLASDAELRALASNPFAVIALWVLRDARNGDALASNLHSFIDDLRAMTEREHGRDELHTILSYIVITADEPTAARVLATVAALAPQFPELTMTLAEKWEHQGIEKGREEGLHRGQVQLLATLLTQRFGPLPAPYRERLDRATTEELQAITNRILTASSLEELFAVLHT